ncbi:hypothetical protein [Vulcanimicrobium alpinum]|nr:hypothetical protein [Vulcanimicrobium alpinum]
MRRFPTALLIAVIAVLALAGAALIFWPTANKRYASVDQVRLQRSEIRVAQAVTHAKGPIAREEWRLSNLDGASTAQYEATNRAGSRVAKFTYPIHGYDVTFAFEALVRDGVWELRSRPLRGNTDNVYTVSIAQTAGDRSGKHRFTFSDPHYLATSAGREYNIHLDPAKPVPDLLTLKSTATADGRYQKIVDDFASFGPPGFRKTVAAAREKLLKS